MESGHLLSPESTVTSLLSSSSHLRSSLLAPEHNSTFRYRDKNYTSASAALDAYISDFERSRSSQFVTGGAGSASQSALHAEGTQSEHAQKHRCSQGTFDRQRAGLPEPPR
ncbi:hypothetical protein OYC64_010184 [Pagothenia borchgrevinki]|uniref:Uncharacterized protein n=1 Tax=Pagothenia borchgrevinki TaxID=8213 RepID=A0ABD2GV12_PAGBO